MVSDSSKPRSGLEYLSQSPSSTSSGAMLPNVVEAMSYSASHICWNPVLFLAAEYGPKYLAACAIIIVGMLRRKRMKNMADIHCRKLKYSAMPGPNSTPMSPMPILSG